MRKLTYYAKKALHSDDDIIICAGDVETEGLGGKLLMIQWGMWGHVKTATGPNMLDEFFNDMLEFPKPAIWFFHFAQYDWRYFLDYFIEHELQVEIGMRTENDIYEIRVRRTESDQWSIMRDSWALWSHKLASLAESFCPELPKLNIEIENFDPTNPEHVEYAKRDVQILLIGLPRLFDMVKENFGINPSGTAAGTALKAWQYTLPKNEIINASEWGIEEAFIRQGYYGGLVFLTSNIAHQNCVTYDRNSSYPASMLEYGVPKGEPHYTNDFEDGYPGFYRVRVSAPDNLIVPILPARNDKGSMRWYRGTFETNVSMQELKFAVEHGYVVQELFEGYFFDDVIFPFEDFISHCKMIRKAFKDKTEEQVAKLMQNSLYGKFGSRRERLRLLNILTCDGDELIGAEPFDDAGKWYVKKELDEDMRCLPQWAAFITANARLSLLKQVYTIGPENVIYGDTDSITIKRGPHELLVDSGKEYGQWKLEKEWEVFRAIAPKVYSGILAADVGKYKAGEYLGAAKGLPRKGIEQKHLRDLLENGETQAQALSLASLKVAMKKGVLPAHTLLRHSSTLTNSMNFDADELGNVRVKYANG